MWQIESDLMTQQVTNMKFHLLDLQPNLLSHFSIMIQKQEGQIWWVYLQKNETSSLVDDSHSMESLNLNCWNMSKSDKSNQQHDFLNGLLENLPFWWEYTIKRVSLSITEFLQGKELNQMTNRDEIISADC